MLWHHCFYWKATFNCEQLKCHPLKTAICVSSFIHLRFLNSKNTLKKSLSHVQNQALHPSHSHSCTPSCAHSQAPCPSYGHSHASRPSPGQASAATPWGAGIPLTPSAVIPGGVPILSLPSTPALDFIFHVTLSPLLSPSTLVPSRTPHVIHLCIVVFPALDRYQLCYPALLFKYSPSPLVNVG